jgi:NAD(P)-dependent dehydrogenase (short-subunit alcohol dehydrogenase family)
MDLQIAGLRVLVTAGAGGIGRATARAFAAEGARVHICDVDRQALAAMAESDPAITQSVCDVSDRSAVAGLIGDTIAALGGLDCLVNNAGIAGPTGRVDEIDPADWDNCVAIDLTGQFNCTRLAVQHLKQSRNASIVNLSSQAGKHGFPLRSPYAAAKWGVIGFTKALSAELGEFGIRANAICPGLVDAARIQSVIANKARSGNISHEEMTAKLFAGVSIKQFVDPADIARQIVFLASPFAKTISGQEFSICGDTRMLS